jgi:hypothetical protein
MFRSEGSFMKLPFDELPLGLSTAVEKPPLAGAVAANEIEDELWRFSSPIEGGARVPASEGAEIGRERAERPLPLLVREATGTGRCIRLAAPE